jgi:hypothetical protein
VAVVPVEFVSVLLGGFVDGDTGVRSSSPFCGLVALCANPTAATSNAPVKSAEFKTCFMSTSL